MQSRNTLSSDLLGFWNVRDFVLGIIDVPVIVSSKGKGRSREKRRSKGETMTLSSETLLVLSTWDNGY